MSEHLAERGAQAVTELEAMIEGLCWLLAYGRQEYRDGARTHADQLRLAGELRTCIAARAELESYLADQRLKRS